MSARDSVRVPTATYRLQLNAGFTFRDATALVDYLHALGISDAYVSPPFKARQGSVHGYDVVDHGSLNPEIGTEDDLAAFSGALRERDMGLVVDVVPNHMCITSSANGWWQDVLENGPSSPFARFFDIDWKPPKAELADRVLLPILGDQYGRILEAGEIQVRWEAETGSFAAHYWEHRLPLAPRTWTRILELVLTRVEGRLEEDAPDRLELESIITAISHLPPRTETDPERIRERQREKEIVKRRLRELVERCEVARTALEEALAHLNGRPGDPHSFDDLEQLLAAQPWRLSYWRVASDEINYRRFFDINELAALRVEDPEVNDAAHALIFDLVRRGWVTGLRIDHVDGLYTPLDYVRALPRSTWRIVEKILMKGERLPADWPVHGTTGYEFLNLVNGLFVDPEAAVPFRALYARVLAAGGDGHEPRSGLHGETARHASFASTVYACKKLVLQVAMSSELTVLARRLDRISEQHRFSRDFTRNSLRDALTEVIACFPVYRTYVRPEDDAPSPEDRAHIESAIRTARRRNPAVSRSLYEFIASVLLLEDPPGLPEDAIRQRREFVLKFQQVTGPVMAKGLEDTASYRYVPLASLNDVGGEPVVFGITPSAFHQACVDRQETWPAAMSASSTHDTKRAEDVRARIDVLSEIPERWEQAVGEWRAINEAVRPQVEGTAAPDANEEYLLYQTLVGSWPPEGLRDDGRAAYVERIREYMRKALKEAKLHTSWINPDEEYEQAVCSYVERILAPGDGNRFPASFERFLVPVLRPGLLNGVAQTLLKIAAPGIPDFYQGTELFDFSLVDPDNRRPVDWDRRRRTLSAIREASPGDMLARIQDGRLKMHVVRSGLALRRSRETVFREGTYRGLEPAGRQADRVVAFARVHADGIVIAATGRFFTGLPDPPIGAGAWTGTRIPLPDGSPTRYRDHLTGRDLVARDGVIEAPSAFAELPFVLLEGLT